VALIALFTTVIPSYAQDTSRDYGNYQYFDGSIFDGSGQEDPQFNDIRQAVLLLEQNKTNNKQYVPKRY